VEKRERKNNGRKINKGKINEEITNVRKSGKYKRKRRKEE
jgi:hypothetical protein